jgi:hypothetical protein
MKKLIHEKTKAFCLEKIGKRRKGMKKLEKKWKWKLGKIV